MLEVLFHTFQSSNQRELSRDLLATNVSWKYAIDVAGSEQVGPLSQKATILVEVYPFLPDCCHLCWMAVCHQFGLVGIVDSLVVL